MINATALAPQPEFSVIQLVGQAANHAANKAVFDDWWMRSCAGLPDRDDRQG